MGDLVESRSFRSLSVLAPCSTDTVERMDLKREEAQRRFRHVSIKRLQGKIADISKYTNVFNMYLAFYDLLVFNLISILKSATRFRFVTSTFLLILF